MTSSTIVSGRSSTQSFHWSGLVEERVHAVRDRVAGRLVAGDGEHDHEVAELVVVEPAAVLVGVDQPGDDVVLRVLAYARRPCPSRRRAARSRPPAGRPRSPGPRWRASSWTSGTASCGPPAVRRSGPRWPAAAARPRAPRRSRPSRPAAASLTIRLARSRMIVLERVDRPRRETARDDVPGAVCSGGSWLSSITRCISTILAVHPRPEADDRAVLGGRPVLAVLGHGCDVGVLRSPPSSRCRPPGRCRRATRGCSTQ